MVEFRLEVEKTKFTTKTLARSIIEYGTRIYWYGGFQAINQELKVGIVIAFVAYLANLYRPLSQLANVYVGVRGALAVFARIFEYLDIEPEVADRSDGITLSDIEGEIVLESVSFSYAG